MCSVQWEGLVRVESSCGPQSRYRIWMRYIHIINDTSAVGTARLWSMECLPFMGTLRQIQNGMWAPLLTQPFNVLNRGCAASTMELTTFENLHRSIYHDRHVLRLCHPPSLAS